MSGNGRTVYIAGAGIAGMTLALALAKFGATVVVLERNASVQEVGAGLQISPNARKKFSTGSGSTRRWRPRPSNLKASTSIPMAPSSRC